MVNSPHLVCLPDLDKPWMVSFTSHNPAPGECVTFEDRKEAELLIDLVEQLLEQVSVPKSVSEGIMDFTGRYLKNSRVDLASTDNSRKIVSVK